jgi:hypothetical protein
MRPFIVILCVAFCFAVVHPVFVTAQTWTPDSVSDLVFKVEVRDTTGMKTGTAFLLRTKGSDEFRVFLTCRHVIRDEASLLVANVTDIKLRLHRGKSVVPVSHITFSEQRDVAVLFVPTSYLRSLQGDRGFMVPETTKHRTGDPVWSFGFPSSWSGSQPLFYEGKISRKAPFTDVEGNKVPHLVPVNMDAHHGHSGGPASTPENPLCLFGVMTSKSKDISGEVSSRHEALRKLKLATGQLPLQQGVVTEGGEFLDFNTVLTDITTELTRAAHIGIGWIGLVDLNWIDELVAGTVIGPDPKPPGVQAVPCTLEATTKDEL